MKLFTRIKNLFPKKNKEATEAFFKYLKVKHEDGVTNLHDDINDEDIKRWLYLVTRSIQKSLARHPEIQNYLTSQMQLGGQQIEFSLVKDFQSGPHAMRLAAEKENQELKARVQELETKLKEVL